MASRCYYWQGHEHFGAIETHIVYKAIDNMRCLSDSGVTFSPPVNFATGHGNIARDIIAVPNDDLNNAYQSANAIQHINEHSGSFSSSAEIDTADKDRMPALAASGNGVYLVFEVQARNSASDIFYARSGPLPGGAAAP